ncbi:hypothetical protein BGZ95_000730 [Linnemannia exigua]|uniref:F-box domain-containing protein n=1 Tax=Linnemannia exigua TaxID=604196 RepID=A0AAD4D7U1_9FUNG|nr:hypothetical protein BGZ95_000730 [Linnemannia exigua]
MEYRNDIPTEILLTLGEQLDGPSLCVSLRVCRQWYYALYPLVWTKITKTNWCHPSFPIYESTILSAPFNNKDEELKATRILLFLRHTRHFEWKDVRVSRRHDNGGHDSDGTRILVNRVPFPTLPPILCWMPNLTQFSLILPHSKPSNALLLSILDPVNLQNLKTLVLDFPSKYPKMRIERLYPLFSKLEELRIHGPWYCGPNPDSNSHVDTEATTVSADALVSNLMNLKRLAVDWVLDSFFKRCLTLEHLTIKYPMIVSAMDESHRRPHELCVLLRQMPKLETIALRHNTAVNADEFSIRSSTGPYSPWRRTLKWGEYFEGADLTLEDIVDRLF